MTPRTSIVTVTKDRPEYLAEAIASVEAQTDTDWEHLVYDNASGDPRVLDVLRAAKVRNPDRFFYTSPGVGGPAVPAIYWNILIGLSRGRYITILDDDNRKRPEFLSTLVGLLAGTTTIRIPHVVSCGWAPIDASGASAGEDRHWNLLTSIPRLWQSNTIDSNAMMFRRSVFDRVGQFRTDLPACEDWDFTIRLAKAYFIVHSEKILVDYRVHDGGRSARISGIDKYAAWNRIRKEYFTEEEEREARALGGMPAVALSSVGG